MVKSVKTSITVTKNGHFSIPNIVCENIINIEVLNYYSPVCLTSHGDLYRIMNIGLGSYPTCVKEGTTINVKVWYI